MLSAILQIKSFNEFFPALSSGLKSFADDWRFLKIAASFHLKLYCFHAKFEPWKIYGGRERKTSRSKLRSEILKQHLAYFVSICRTLYMFAYGVNSVVTIKTFITDTCQGSPYNNIKGRVNNVALFDALHNKQGIKTPSCIFYLWVFP